MSRFTPRRPSAPPLADGSGAGLDPTQTYSPHRRTGLLFTGTGTHGAYHAGVLRALHEAGVRVDVVAGHGVGAATAMLAAIDGGAKLWDPRGIWAPARARRYYRWQWPMRLSAVLIVLLAVACVVPLVVLALGAVAYAAAFLLGLVGAGLGNTLAERVAAVMAAAFSGAALPTVVPRVVMMLVLALAAVVAAAGWRARVEHAGVRRNARTPWWWRALGSSLDTEPLRRAVSRSIWELVRGAARPGRPDDEMLSRRYVDVLSENLGQPGCRELMIAVADLDARRDIVGALLGEEMQPAFFAARHDRSRAAEVVDLAWSARDMVADLLAAALTPPVGAGPYPMTFPQDGYWRGETHRACDRPGICGRLLSELSAAGVVQVLVVSAAAPPAAPHHLRTPPDHWRARLGEYLSTDEAAALDEALAAGASRFDAVFRICPSHNPAGPFDSAGTYDEGSDRRFSIGELQTLGYQDAHRLFIDPVVGASGDELVPALP